MVQQLFGTLVGIWLLLAALAHMIGGSTWSSKIISVPLRFLKRQALRLLKYIKRKTTQLLAWLLRLIFVRFPPTLWRGIVRLKRRFWP